MSNQTNKLAVAYDAFKSGDYQRSRQLLLDCEPRQAAHLRGLVERRLGRFSEAQKQLELALRFEPNNHEIYHNQALVWLDLHSPERAFPCLNKAIQLKPDFVAAHRTLGRSLREAGRWEEARTFYQQLLQRLPHDFGVLFGLGSAELEMGEAEKAFDRFSKLLNSGRMESAVLFMHGRAALQSGHLETAQASLLKAHQTGATALTLRELCRLLWMRDDREAFAKLLEGPFADPQMLTVALEMLRQSGAPVNQLVALSDTCVETNAEDEAIIAQAWVDAGSFEPAGQHADRCLTLVPNHARGMAAKISALLMAGELEQAYDLACRMHEQDPHAQQWIAYQATALRALGSAAYPDLVDIEKHVRVFNLPVPPEYESIDAFNQALSMALDNLQLFAAQPIDQSLRLGTQTARDLRSVDDPAIRAYLKALDEPIRQYINDMGTADDHPLSGRNKGDYRLSGCWSVKLTGGGHHVNHMHPEGWISSAYYVTVPKSASGSRSGWIKFSEPPFSTKPKLEPERWIEPVGGLLVLFPSYLWHGTEPISDSAVRVTAPFDAVPNTP
ncbi:MAG: putative 2OG-Fe(II) oxygenase [Gammaproteobacteria bacterium]